MKRFYENKESMSAAKRTLTVRLLYALVAVISIVVLVLFVTSPGSAECDAYLSSFNRYINFRFDRYVKSASVQVKFLDRNGSVVGDETYTLKGDTEFRVSLTDGDFYYKVDRIVVSNVHTETGFDRDTMRTVYTICIVFIVASVYGILTTRSKKTEVDGHNVEMYNGPIRRYIACDGIIVAHNGKGYLMHSKEEAVIGSYLLKVTFYFYGKIEVKQIKLSQSGQESAENTTNEVVESAPTVSAPAAEAAAEGAAETKNAEENALPAAAEEPPIKGALVEKSEVRKGDKSKEKLTIRTIYAVSILIILALAGGAIALFAVGAFYVFPVILLVSAVPVGLVGFKCRFKQYDINGHKVILYSGIIRRYIRVDGEIEESAVVSKENRTIVLNARVGSLWLEAVFSGYRHMELKVLYEENK